MNTDSIFGLFDQGKDPIEINKSELEVDFSEHPIVLLGMFKKLIINFDTFKDRILHKYSNSNPELDEKDISRAGELILYNRAWEYINKIDIKNSFHFECIITRSDKNLFKAMKLALTYFELTEEYEKCAKIKPIFDLIKINLKK